MTSPTPRVTRGELALLAGLAAWGLYPLVLLILHATSTHTRLTGADGLIGAGADATFLTKPAKRLSPNLRTKSTPKRDRKSPYKFTTFGSLHGNAVVPASLRCTGRATVNYYRGKIRTAHASVPVQPNCTFAASISFRHKHGKGVVPITVKIHYQGNGYLAGAKKVNHLKIGRR